jgi:UDP-glucose 4-epimerase
VTGGAGYIGAHVVRLLHQRGDHVVVVDDLSSGRAERAGGAPITQLNLSAANAVDVVSGLLAEHQVDAVIHFAARKQVGESVERPTWYWQQNIGGMANLLTAMEQVGVDKLVFSSSAATYGMPDFPLISEDIDCRPINPYGETKLVGEWLTRDSARAHGLRAVNLRYFNVAGAGWPDLGDPGTFNLIPIVLAKITAGGRATIFGDDYPTPDGTCIRDYVHVLDLADAHLAALSYLDRPNRPYDTFNVGTGTGASVSEVLAMIGEVSGLDATPDVLPRRAGDPPKLVADVSRIAETLGWAAQHDLREIVESAWAAWQASHPA